MSDVIIDVGSNKTSRINLGIQGENIVEHIIFNIASWIEEYGEGVAYVYAKRSGDLEPYPVALDMDMTKKTATWDVNLVDTAVKGGGSAQLVYVVDEDNEPDFSEDEVKKTKVFATTVQASLVVSSEENPEGYSTWLEVLGGYTVRVESAKVAAQAAQTAAETAQGLAEDAQEAAESARDAAQSSQAGASASATNAAASASAAATSETNAANSATSASSSASAASASATNASNSASAAAASAATAGTAATNASQSATAAAGSATSAGQSASAASSSASSAAQSATSASSSASAASTSETNAAASATSASGSASSAAQSATNASGSASTATAAANTATTKASEASASATSAAESASDASDSADAAAASAEAAAQSAASLTVDTELDDTSTNPVQNKVITAEITDLKEDLEYNLSVEKEIVGAIPAFWHFGGMYSATGIEYSSRNKMITDFSECEETEVIIYNPTSLTLSLYEFASNTTTSSGVNERLAVSYFANGLSTRTLNSSTKYIRLQIDGTDLNGTHGIYVQTKDNVIDNKFANITKEYALSLYNEKGILDLNSVIGNHIYFIDSSFNYTNKPSGFTIGHLMCVLTGKISLQLAWQYNGGKMWKRRGNIDGSTWEDWQLVSGYTNSYTFNEYSNSYTIEEVAPSLTTDTNAYLAPSGDTSDRTADIIAVLNSYGVCRLGKGTYYVNNLEMPSGTSIIGVGNSTKIILSGSSDGYAIKMNSYCNVSDCCIQGGTSSIPLSSTLGGRHGILWQGNYTQTKSSELQPINGMVNNVRFLYFTGGAITCYDTGYGTFNALEVSNVFCMNCNAGINISYWSEFHKFTNVRTASCYYGCINNGGNNVFVNCDFSTCKVGFLMDNANNQSPNNSHGSCVGCVFNHTDSNTGVGIKVLNCGNGFIFDGCQIFFSQIHIEDSDGIVVTNSNIGDTNCGITISCGGCVLFSNNMHQATSPSITITNNNKVHFANCYVRSTGVSVTPS